MTLIDNQDQTMHQALVNAHSSADKVDIEVVFFLLFRLATVGIKFKG